MSLHPDHLASIYDAKVMSQRVKNDFFWKLLQKNSPEMEPWLAGAIKMVMDDVGEIIDQEQREFWERIQDPAAPTNVKHVFFFYCVSCYRALQHALLDQVHHAPGALSTFMRTDLPRAFDELFDGQFKMTGADIFARHVRHLYISTVGFYTE